MILTSFREGISNLYFIVLFLLAFIGAGLFAGISALGIILFLSVNIAGIFLPGYYMVEASGLKLKNSTSLLFVSYGLGYGIWAIIYAIFILANIHNLSHYLLYVVSMLSILYLLFGSKRTEIFQIVREKNRDNAFLLFLFIVLILLCFIVYQFPLQSALNIGYQNMYFDDTYWFKNCVASTKGYPLPELSVLGNTLCWHLFSCFNIALFYFATGIEIYDLCFSLSYVWHVFLLVGSVYALVSEYISNKNLAYTACIIILVCSSIEPLTWVYYLEHMYGCTLGVADGMALSLFATLIIFKSIDRFHIDYKLAFLAVLLIVATIGAKSPYGSVVLVGAVVGAIYVGIRNKKVLLPSLFIILSIVAIFIIINKLFIIDGDALTSSTSSHKLSLNFATVSRPSIVGKIIVLLEEIGISKILTAFVLIIPYLLSTHIAMPILGVCVYGLYKKRKEVIMGNDMLSVVLMSLFSMLLAGIGIFVAFDHPGFSQVYFLFAGIPFAVVFSFVTIEHLFSLEYNKYRIYVYILIGCSVCATLLFIKPTFLLEEYFNVNPTRKAIEGTSVTRNEIIGLRWVRDNLPEDAILLTNKVLEPESGNKSFVTSAYSERQVYLEGWVSTNLPNDHIVNDRIELMKRYFDGDNDAYVILKKEGVEYVVVFNSISSINIESNKILYENDEIKIATL